MKTAALLVLVPVLGWSSASIHFGDEREVDVGLALRTSAWASDSNAAGVRGGAEVDFVVGSISGQLTRWLKAQLAVAAAAAGSVQLLDAVAMIEPSPFAKVWVGQFVPPSDRATLTGPFLSAAWDPVFVSPYPSGFAGRDDGAALWGELFWGRLHYSAGAFRGQAPAPSWEGRLAVDLLDVESGYYRPGSYDGAKRVLSLGASAHHQGHAYSGGEVDLFAEAPLPFGVFDVEAELDRSEPVDLKTPHASGAYAQLSWMPREPTTVGRPQVWARYQWLKPDGVTPHTRAELGLGWIVDGPFIRAGLTLARDEGPASWSARLGVQVIL